MEHHCWTFIKAIIIHKKNKFTWVDTVKVKLEAPKDFHPGEIVLVYSLVEISPEDLKIDPTLIEPTWLYTVEFGDGSSIWKSLSAI